MGLKEEILGQADLETVEVAVPEWGGRKVLLKALSGVERDAYELSAFNENQAAKKESRKPRNMRARLLVYCVVDERGERVFGDAEVDSLGGKSGSALDRLWEAARKLNGYTEADAKALQGEAEKN